MSREPAVEPTSRSSTSFMKLVKSHWSAMTFLLMVAGGGVAGAGMLAAKADATDLRTQEVRIQALERKESAADRDRDWMLKAQDEIKKQLTDIQRRLPPPSVP